jgi:hypothetical protein
MNENQKNISKSTYQAITPRACRPSIRKVSKVPNEKRNPWEREFSGRSCFPGLIWIDSTFRQMELLLNAAPLQRTRLIAIKDHARGHFKICHTNARNAMYV